MPDASKQEVWLRGPLTGISPLLQPVAQALLQAREEAEALMTTFGEKLLWIKPAGLASAAFHLQHLTGVLDRLLTYARGEALNEKQLAYLAAEGKEDRQMGKAQLVKTFGAQVDKAIAQIKVTDDQQLTEKRGVGRAQLPSTVIGLLVHAAEHTQRHIGQLLVTVRVVTAGEK